MIENNNSDLDEKLSRFPKLNQEYMTSTSIKCHQKLTNYYMRKFRLTVV